MRAVRPVLLPSFLITGVGSTENLCQGSPREEIRYINQSIASLEKLDKSSPKFPDQLEQLLNNGRWITNLMTAPEDEMGKLIGNLDEVKFVSKRTEVALISLVDS